MPGAGEGPATTGSFFKTGGGRVLVKYLWGTLFALALVFLGAGVYYFIKFA
ncbi:hypothetical protein SAMN04487970_101631 [Paenibacillus tianmuensis]|uniref:Uncharacterized protein n=1 Tax=Paenibacillus tianmuensis TaxID=624147 RepID=A0A1G4RIR6_9BACL|nr:hypothetical protein SAMN04487970_101631 [Paenibacillus tianmuensis]